jgi:hypothetical protein
MTIAAAILLAASRSKPGSMVGRIDLAGGVAAAVCLVARALALSLLSTAVAQQLFSSCAARGGKAWGSFRDGARTRTDGGHEIAAA